MRALFLSSVAVGFLLVLAGPGRAQDEARALVDKAIKAHGGEAALTKYKAGQMKGKGTLEVAGGLTIAQEVVFLLPDKFKESIEFDFNGQKVNMVYAFDGTKVAIKVNGQEMKADDKLLAEFKEAGHMLKIGRLVALKDKAYELSPLGEMKVEGKPALGLRVVTKGFKDVSLFFDKESGLLLKMERRGVDPMSGQEFAEERFIQEYQKLDDVPVPKKVLINRDGKKFLELEVLEMKFLETVDENEFNVS